MVHRQNNALFRLCTPLLGPGNGLQAAATIAGGRAYPAEAASSKRFDWPAGHSILAIAKKP
ncbi:MAG TPA: hypothetical protein ENJ09_00835 [Planctomycetes bacterium]|nr:hypothetical protein [Planctomycetota bacterium]